jgi:hypothetical protein
MEKNKEPFPPLEEFLLVSPTTLPPAYVINSRISNRLDSDSKLGHSFAGILYKCLALWNKANNEIAIQQKIIADANNKIAEQQKLIADARVEAYNDSLALFEKYK